MLLGWLGSFMGFYLFVFVFSVVCFVIAYRSLSTIFLIDYHFFPGVTLAGADSDEQIALFKNINLLDLIFGGFFRLDGLGTPYRRLSGPGVAYIVLVTLF